MKKALIFVLLLMLFCLSAWAQPAPSIPAQCTIIGITGTTTITKRSGPTGIGERTVAQTAAWIMGASAMPTLNCAIMASTAEAAAAVRPTTNSEAPLTLACGI
jgi:hypothetical protein